MSLKKGVRVSCFFIVVALLATVLHAKNLKKKEFGNVAVKDVVSIYDGDTFRVNIEGWPDIIGHGIPIRLNGIDAPEIRGKKRCQKEKDQAQKSRQHTIQFLQSAKHIELRNMKRGKYFRILADVYGDGESLADSLIKTGLVRKYSGGKRKGWCKKSP